MSAAKILAVDAHPVVREGIKAALDGNGYRVAAEACSAKEALGKMNKDIEVMITEAELHDMRTEHFIGQVKEKHPQVGVLVFSSRCDAATIRALLSAGAAGFLSKNGTLSRLPEALASVQSGKIFLCAHAQKAVLKAQGLLDNPRQLSPRELEVLECIAKGHSSGKIAREKKITARTVETHRKNLMKKMQVKNTAALLAKAFREKLL